MTVYVDDMYKIPLGRFGRMKMSHMIATTDEELHEMAQRLGLRREWHQGDHYDVSMEKRELAIRYGARPILLRECACMMKFRRFGLPMPEPEDAIRAVAEHTRRLREEGRVR